jgi:HK97 family phage prohead protease
MKHETEWLATTSPIEYRSAAAGKPAIIQGYASVFNSPSQPMGHQGVVETVAPSFHNKQKGDDNFRNVIAKYDHRSDFLLGSVEAGNLELEVRSGGLWYAVHINPETRSGGDVYEWVKSKIVRGSSFGFIAFDDSWGWNNGHAERTLLSGKTVDVGPTSTPAYEASSALALRSLATHVEADYETVVEDAKAGNLQRYFVRTDQQVSAPVTVPPTPLDVSYRSMEPNTSSVDLRRKRLELWAKKIEIDTGHRPDEPRQQTTPERLLELRRRKILWDNEPVEARSLADFPRDRYGHAIDWHPWHR